MSAWVIVRYENPAWLDDPGIMVLPAYSYEAWSDIFQDRFQLQVVTVYLADCQAWFGPACRCRKCWYNGFGINP